MDSLKAILSDELSYELDSLPGFSRKSNVKTGEILCYLKLIHIPSSLAKQGNWLCVANSWLCLSFCYLECHRTTQLPGVVASPPQMGLEDALYSGVTMSQQPCQSGKGKAYSRVFSILIS